MGDEHHRWTPCGARATPLDDEGDVWVVSLPKPALPTSLLTSAEAAVAGLAIAGLSNAEIAAARNTSVRTVANQLRSIYGKLEINSRTELLERLNRDV